MKKPIYDKGIIIGYEDDDILEEVSEEISEGSTPEEIAEEVIDEVTDNVEDQIEVETGKDVDLEVVTTTEPTEQIPSQEEFEINNTDNSVPNSSEEVKEGLDDLDTLLKDTLEISENSDNEVIQKEMQEKLEESIKIINKLKKRNSELEISLAEREGLGDNYGLSPSLVIIKTNYDKAIEGDAEALDKIKQILLSDLGIEFNNKKDTVFGFDIYSNNDYSYEDNDSGFRVGMPI